MTSSTEVRRSCDHESERLETELLNSLIPLLEHPTFTLLEDVGYKGSVVYQLKQVVLLLLWRYSAIKTFNFSPSSRDCSVSSEVPDSYFEM